MSWVDSMQDVGGRLVPAALDFVHSQEAALPGSGATGVRWLADRIERFVDEDAPSIDDDRFVEGAGALLGLLLIKHLGGKTRAQNGVHRVQLGQFGWFDPFVAISQAMDADDPRRCLAEYLVVAEKEAHQAGPVSRVVSIFAAVLAEARPDLHIRSQFELSVELSNDATVDLSRLEKVARDQDEAAITEAAHRLVSMLPGNDGPRETSWEEAAPRLFPRLVADAFLESLPRAGSLYLEEIGHDVYLALQLRYGPRARYVRKTEVAHWSSNDDPFHRAVRNLASRSQDLRLEPVDHGVLRVCQGDGLDAARLVLPDLAVRLRQLSRQGWIASAPHRDVLLVAPATESTAVAALAADAAERAPHPISQSLFSISEDGISAIER
ncbi:MAG: hypothetical protein AAF436_18315 [Myxococcota bacterium]